MFKPQKPIKFIPLQIQKTKPKQKKSLAWRYLEFVNRIFNFKQKPTQNSNGEDLTDPTHED